MISHDSELLSSCGSTPAILVQSLLLQDTFYDNDTQYEFAEQLQGASTVPGAF
jgi:hypothetical protein